MARGALPRGTRPRVEPDASRAGAVVGAHLSGLPLNGELTSRGATLVEATTTAPEYRLFALARYPPPKPGLVRSDRGGAPIAVEVWALPRPRSGSFLASIASPLGLGTIDLADGRQVHGFLCEPHALGDCARHHRARRLARLPGFACRLTDPSEPAQHRCKAAISPIVDRVDAKSDRHRRISRWAAGDSRPRRPRAVGAARRGAAQNTMTDRKPTSTPQLGRGSRSPPNTARAWAGTSTCRRDGRTARWPAADRGRRIGSCSAGGARGRRVNAAAAAVRGEPTPRVPPSPASRRPRPAQRLHGASSPSVRAKADAVDARRRGASALQLAGVPFAVKNLFDVAGLTTLAGSKIERDTAPAARDAVLVGASKPPARCCVGALNMDEYAYGFTTENTPRRRRPATRTTWRASPAARPAARGAAVAAGQVPLALGSDTNGSIRVPASLCGVCGLKPTFGRLPRTRHLSVRRQPGPSRPARPQRRRDLALAYDAMQGPERARPGCARAPVEPVAGVARPRSAGLRVGHSRRLVPRPGERPRRGGGRHRWPRARRSDEVDGPTRRARARRRVHHHRRRGRRLHLADLRRRAARFRPDDARPLPRQRAAAGAWVMRAQRLRRWFARRVARAVRDRRRPDRAGHARARAADRHRVARRRRRAPARARPSMGLLTQPISFIGLPVVTVPMWASTRRSACRSACS